MAAFLYLKRSSLDRAKPLSNDAAPPLNHSLRPKFLLNQPLTSEQNEISLGNGEIVNAAHRRPPAPFPAMLPAVADCCPVPIKKAYSPQIGTQDYAVDADAHVLGLE